MKLIKRLVLGLLVLLILLALGGFLLPAEVTVKRTVTVERPPAEIYRLLNGFEHFNAWSPWYALDPEADYRFEGPATGVGATMHWNSDDPSVGAGSQRITGVTANERIEIALEFAGQDPAASWMQLTPVAAGTEVEWGFSTDFGMNPLGRYLGLMLDNWVGADYQRGLDQFKAFAEGRR
ncbi:MAG: SRPBCC family protein [Wenzhouxiangellaceae bacterium]